MDSTRHRHAPLLTVVVTDARLRPGRIWRRLAGGTDLAAGEELPVETGLPVRSAGAEAAGGAARGASTIPPGPNNTCGGKS